MNSFHCSIRARLLMAGTASLAIMTVSIAGVRAETVIGADGTPGDFCFGDPSVDGSCAVNGGDGESVSAAGSPAVAIGGNGGAAGETDYGFGDGDGSGNGGNGGSATAAATGGSIVSASATGGQGGYSDLSYGGSGGNAAATSKAFGGSGGASSSAYATGGSATIDGVGGSAAATANPWRQGAAWRHLRRLRSEGDMDSEVTVTRAARTQPRPRNPPLLSATFGRPMRR
jgi:hypothetical protein